MAKLFYYLSSGRSHVGYLYNYHDNPIHNIGKVMYESIEVQPEMPTQLLAGLTLGARKDKEDEKEEPEELNVADIDDSGISSGTFDSEDDDAEDMHID